MDRFQHTFCCDCRGELLNYSIQEWVSYGLQSLPEMAYGAADIHVCNCTSIIQALVIANYKLTSVHEYH